MSDALPDAKLEVIPDAGHAPHLEKPAEWLEAVETFLERRNGKGSTFGSTPSGEAGTERGL